MNPEAQIASFGGGGPAPVTYISSGYRWRYLDNGSNQGSAWRAENFDDSAWSSGPSELGYGSNDEGSGTTLSFGPNSSSKYLLLIFGPVLRYLTRPYFLISSSESNMMTGSLSISMERRRSVRI